MAADNSQAIAQIYAEALFELALEQGQTEPAREELAALAGLVREAPGFAVFLETPAVNRYRKAEAISRIFTNQVSPLIMNFLMVLANKDRLRLLGDIHTCYANLEDKRAGRVKGSLTTACELEQKDKSRLTEQIGRALRKTVELQTAVDPSLIGGMILTVEDTVMDCSIKQSLGQLARQIRQETRRQLREDMELLVSE